MAWVKSHAKHRMNHYQSKEEQETRGAGLALLPQYMKVASYLVPSPKDEAANNVLEDASTYEITNISGIPRMFRHSRHIREGWKKIEDGLESETRHKYYKAQMPKRASGHWVVLSQKRVPIMRQPVWLVIGLWETWDLFFFPQSLIALVAHWEGIFRHDQSLCPLQFTRTDIELHSKEEETSVVCRANSRKFNDVSIGLGQDESEKMLFSKLWPYQVSGN
ncbi:uncharacterized protein BDW43DRAFT_297079 [Aspergillus alliaceus]|uniref:uncharacterized protein n=1 Tax=Petromyces alliaceus TaxID=209559 RepID=UPI0012A6A3D5|nr:uncharacterized protein BDW43DRAFT_297079 [Aspergillus alliaceus]KAB8238140.1 hypothetical protein BDW43DRAFT_297079 [Aspergillus alliaceus]